jgi:hypothetical protein
MQNVLPQALYEHLPPLLDGIADQIVAPEMLVKLHRRVHLQHTEVGGVAEGDGGMRHVFTSVYCDPDAKPRHTPGRFTKSFCLVTDDWIVVEIVGPPVQVLSIKLLKVDRDSPIDVTAYFPLDTVHKRSGFRRLLTTV